MTPMVYLIPLFPSGWGLLVVGALGWFMYDEEQEDKKDPLDPTRSSY